MSTEMTPEKITIIKATVPILETGGEVLTNHFYKMMLNDYPEVRCLFNQANQESGKQPRALANSVLCYARNIDALQNLGPLAGQIVNKHVALQILPEHYPIVGNCLLKSIREVLGAEVATDAVIDAWGCAYQQLANILIAAEGKAYDDIEKAEGGWRHARQFTVSAKVPESSEITSFYLTPVDGKKCIVAKAGQYLGLKVFIDGNEHRRNYSLSSVCDGKGLRISVKRVEGGVVSTYLHDQVKEGDELSVMPPAGDFVFDSESTRPVVLVSAGVGATPTLAMLTVAAQSQRKVDYVHFARNAAVHAFKNQVASVCNDQIKMHTVYTRDGVEARPTVESMAQQFGGIIQDTNVDAYVLGPKGFMAVAIKALKSIGVPAEQIKYEFFGPHEQLDL